MANRASAVALDFTNVKEQGQFNTKRVPAGDYLAQIIKVEDAVSKKDDTNQWLYTVKLKKFSQNSYPYYCKLQENQLWKIRNIFIAAGVTIPKKRVKVDPNKVVGKLVGVTMEDDEYEGREKSVIAAIFPAAELADGASVDDDDADDLPDTEDEDTADDLDDEPAEEEAEEDEAEEEEEEAEEETNPYADYDRARLKREIKKLDSTYSVKRSQSDDDLREVLAGLAGGGDDEEEEEEEPEPAPVKKTAVKRKAKPAPVSDDDLEELDIDDL